MKLCNIAVDRTARRGLQSIEVSISVPAGFRVDTNDVPGPRVSFLHDRGLMAV
jgi:hypothetical protein